MAVAQKQNVENNGWNATLKVYVMITDTKDKSSIQTLS